MIPAWYSANGSLVQTRVHQGRILRSHQQRYAISDTEQLCFQLANLSRMRLHRSSIRLHLLEPKCRMPRMLQHVVLERRGRPVPAFERVRACGWDQAFVLGLLKLDLWGQFARQRRSAECAIERRSDE